MTTTGCLSSAWAAAESAPGPGRAQAEGQHEDHQDAAHRSSRCHGVAKLRVERIRVPGRVVIRPDQADSNKPAATAVEVEHSSSRGPGRTVARSGRGEHPRCVEALVSSVRLDAATEILDDVVGLAGHGGAEASAVGQGLGQVQLRLGGAAAVGRRSSLPKWKLSAGFLASFLGPRGRTASASRGCPTDSWMAPRVSKNSQGSAIGTARFCRPTTSSRASWLLFEVGVEDPRLVVHGLDRVGHGLEHAVILLDGLREGLAGRVRARTGPRRWRAGGRRG